MNNCPRCINGYMRTRWDSNTNSTLYCLLCGHEIVTISQEVLDEVRLSYGKPALLSTGVALKLLATQSES